MKFWRILAIFLLYAPQAALLFAPQTAWALCVSPALTNVGTPQSFAGAGGEYNVYDPGEYMQSVDFKVSSAATLLSCRYYVTLSAGSSGSAAQRKMVLSGQPDLNYNVYTTLSKTIFAASGSYNGAGVISGSFSTNLSSSNTHSLYWTIAPGQVVHANAARYQDANLTLTLMAELVLGIFTQADSKTITFQARPESSLDLSLVDTGGSFNSGDVSQTVSFGTLSPGAVMAYDTIVRSNDGYDIIMKSANGSVLRHSTYPAVATGIPYSFSFGGNSKDLSSAGAVSVAAGSGTTSAAGDRFATVFTVGAMSGAEAPGVYSDVITVSISAH